MTNTQKILELLEKGGWVCSTNFYALYIADPRTLLAQMKKQGKVESRWCKTHDHKMKEWRLLDNHLTIHPLEQELYQTYIGATSPEIYKEAEKLLASPFTKQQTLNI